MRFTGGGLLRFNDPRRFGSWVLTTRTGRSTRCSGSSARSRFPPISPRTTCGARAAAGSVAIKQHLMNGKVVVGVGNIYANEALFRAGIHPLRAAGKVARARFEPLVGAVRDVLNDALEEGGTTLRNYVDGDGKSGLLPPVAERLRARGRALQAMRHADQAPRAGTARDVLLPALPENRESGRFGPRHAPLPRAVPRSVPRS